MPTKSVNALKSWQEEKRSAYLYRVVSAAEAGSSRAALFARLALEAERQAALWERELEKAGLPIPARFEPDLRTRLVAMLVRRYGPRPLRSVLAAMKVRGMSLYSRRDALGHAMPRTLADVGRRHRGMERGNLRAAVFGVNDGLVSNASLILGVAGATADDALVLLSGLAGLIAGAFSMAAGEYISVRSQREVYEYQIGLEREELNQYPQEEAAELALIYQAKGVPKAEAQRLAEDIIADPAKALDTLAREELGLNPEDLGSPWGAAVFSFVSFASGAAIPLLPFVFASGPARLPGAIVLTGLALFAVGAALSLFTGRRAVRGGLRMLAIGGGAGALTYWIGKGLGVGLG